MSSYLDEIVAAQKQGKGVGITSVCSAHPFVIEAAFRQALKGDTPVLIESTCNQVNQFGGYTGMAPADFIGYVADMAARVGFPQERLIVGGDHLGPNPWQDEPAAQAMAKARDLVRDYVQAGYEKIHLDASMKCADDDPDRPLDTALSAQRAAELAQVAEEAFARRPGASAPRYIIGTEVPIPGGAQEAEEGVRVTPPAEVVETIAITRDAFGARGLDDAWRRVIAVVAQPGVEFGDANLFEYDREAARDLSRFIEGEARLVFEAHSTDYQTPGALRRLVEDHFAILKVGPALTFAFREAVFALVMMEEEWPAGRAGIELSDLRETLDAAMLDNPVHWRKYYGGDEQAQAFARKYSFSDRSRYYWPVPEVQAALARLLRNLEENPPPLSLLSQFAPVQYGHIRAGRIANSPRAIILDRIGQVLEEYAYACGATPCL
jgi:D-tagatose-1,6-bisphosphate aldolase subunit GatZ/KbaZ